MTRSLRDSEPAGTWKSQAVSAAIGTAVISG